MDLTLITPEQFFFNDANPFGDGEQLNSLIIENSDNPGTAEVIGIGSGFVFTFSNTPLSTTFDISDNETAGNGWGTANVTVVINYVTSS